MKFQVDRLKGSMSDLRQSNLEKTLLAWCQQNTKNYSDVKIENFTTSWSDGLAFNALLHCWKPNLIDFDEVKLLSPVERLEHAFDFAVHHLDIEKFLDPEGMFLHLH